MIPIVDMHCDTISKIWKLRNKKQDAKLDISPNADGKCELRNNNLHMDLERMKKAGYMCQNFALFTYLGPWVGEGDADYETPFEYAMALSDIFDSEIAKNSDLIRPVLTANDIEDNFKNDIMSALKTIEEGGVYMGDTDRLKTMYDKGVRMTTFTWNFENELAYPNKLDMKTGKALPDTQHGLKAAGKEFVKACSELGIIIDVSHLNDGGILEIFDITDKDIPIVASHSNARNVTSHPRNLTDEMLRKIADRGGVCGLNFCDAFMNDRNEGYVRLEDICTHAKYIKNIAGIDSLGLGSDFDGIGNKIEMNDCGGMQQLADYFEKEGFSCEEIEKIFYKNVLRVYNTIL